MTTKLNLRKRILLGYLAPLLLMVGVCVAVVWNTQTVLQISKSVELAYAIVDECDSVLIDEALQAGEAACWAPGTWVASSKASVARGTSSSAA